MNRNLNIFFEGRRLDNGKTIMGDIIRDKSNNCYISPVISRLIYSATVVDGNLIKLPARQVDPDTIRLVEKIYSSSQS